MERREATADGARAGPMVAYGRTQDANWIAQREGVGVAILMATGPLQMPSAGRALLSYICPILLSSHLVSDSRFTTEFGN
jgi:hypothetical protein